jgi:hypothetical protein
MIAIGALVDEGEHGLALRGLVAGLISLVCLALGGLVACGGETGTSRLRGPDDLQELSGPSISAPRARGTFRIGVTATRRRCRARTAPCRCTCKRSRAVDHIGV